MSLRHYYAMYAVESEYSASKDFAVNSNGRFANKRYTGIWLRGLDLNQRPLGYEPNELPDCSTPRQLFFKR
jgi:hypothetical protein